MPRVVLTFESLEEAQEWKGWYTDGGGEYQWLTGDEPAEHEAPEVELWIEEGFTPEPEDDCGEPWDDDEDRG